MKKLVLLLIMIGLTANIVHAGALDNGAQGGRAIGMAFAQTGLADDAMAVYYNPAGLAMLGDDKHHLELYSSFGWLSAKVLPTGAEYESNTVSIIPGLAAGRKIGKLGYGLGLNIPYGGGGVKYSDFPVADSNYESGMGVLAITPSIAYQLSPQFSLGLGVSAYYGTMTSKSDTIFFIPMVGTQLITIETAYSGIGGFGANVGALFKPTEQLGIGVNARIPVTMKLKGTITSGTTEQDSELEFKLPMYVTTGLSLQVLPKLLTTADVWYMSYEQTDKFSSTTDGTTTEMETHFKNCVNASLGLEYLLSDPVALRLGLAYSQSGTDDEGLSLGNPDVDKFVMTIGVGYTIDIVTINVAGMLSLGSEREYNGTRFDADTNVLTAGVHLAF